MTQIPPALFGLAVYGLGKSGLALHRFLLKRGIVHHIFDGNQDLLRHTKEAGCRIGLELGIGDLENIRTLIVSPGIDVKRFECRIMRAAIESGIRIICDIQLFWELNQDSTFIAVTGTNGKSTTTSLIGHILQGSGFDVQIGGNIGIPVFDLRPAKVVVLEISSYQLDYLDTASFDVCVLLGISSDHLERYEFDEKKYARSKSRIFLGDKKAKFAIVSLDSEESCKIFDDLDDKIRKFPISGRQRIANGFSCEGESLFLDGIDVGKFPESKLIGGHNRENILAAIASVLVLDSSIDYIDSIKTFRPLEHRLEEIRALGRVRFINDSKATSGEALKVALACFPSVYLILGGRKKTDGLSPIAQMVGRIKKAYIFGEAKLEFQDFLAERDIPFEVVLGVQAATIAAYRDASKRPGERVILFSPACASFDQFANFEERGECFRRAVFAL